MKQTGIDERQNLFSLLSIIHQFFRMISGVKLEYNRGRESLEKKINNFAHVHYNVPCGIKTVTILLKERGYLLQDTSINK
jgi:hypothetical protein